MLTPHIITNKLSNFLSDLHIERGETERLKTDQKLVAPSAISDKRVVRMKLTDPCVLGGGGAEDKIEFSTDGCGG